MYLFSEESIYLHFLDRELRNSLSNNLYFNDRIAEKVLCISLLMTSLPNYISYSHTYESLDLLPNTIQKLFICEKFGWIVMLTSNRSLDEFIATRKSLYSFDKNRYLNYFDSETELQWPNDSQILTLNTTNILRDKLIVDIVKRDFGERIQNEMLSKLIHNKKDALTFSYFGSILKENFTHGHIDEPEYISNAMSIREAISQSYSSRYLDVRNGTIITGIPGFNRYDMLAKNEFSTNYRLYSLIASTYFDSDMFQKVCHFRENKKHFMLFRTLVAEIITILHSVYHNMNPNIDLAASELKRLCLKKVKSEEEFVDQCFKTEMVLSKKYGKVTNNIMNKKLLIVIATDVELDITIKSLRELSSTLIVDIQDDISYLVTRVNNLEIYIVKTQMGSIGPGSSILTIESAIRNIRPDYIIMNGIAFGVNPKKQTIGDVLISKSVWNYESEKITENGRIPRGFIIPASPKLIQMFELSAIDIGIRIHYGTIASGEKLSDNKSFVDSLKTVQPEIIGGDMESVGLASVCHREHCEWIVVKGICDWGYNKNNTTHKKKNQEIAATNASKVLLSFINNISNSANL